MNLLGFDCGTSLTCLEREVSPPLGKFSKAFVSPYKKSRLGINWLLSLPVDPMLAVHFQANSSKSWLLNPLFWFPSEPPSTSLIFKSVIKQSSIRGGLV